MTPYRLSAEAVAELNEIAAMTPEGTLQPPDVVEHAKNPATALHAHFEWDDGVAGEQWRLQQARQVIRCYVVVHPQITRTVRAYVSVPSDRASGNGYRSVAEVVQKPQFLQQMVEEARLKVKSLKASYSFIHQLDGLWPQLDQVFEQYLAEMEGGVAQPRK